MNLLARALRRLKYELLDAPRGMGRSVDAEVWDAQYRAGTWDHLHGERELAHYACILEFIRRRGAAPATLGVLDVGCGDGRLIALLAREGIGRYLGIDVSSVAVERARSLAVAGAEFQVARFEQWQPQSRFDFVVFNESLYYARRPAQTLARYRAALAPSGEFIVSICHYGNHDAIWRTLERYHDAVAAKTVGNDIGQRWTVRALRPRSP